MPPLTGRIQRFKSAVQRILRQAVVFVVVFARSPASGLLSIEEQGALRLYAETAFKANDTVSSRLEAMKLCARGEYSDYSRCQRAMARRKMAGSEPATLEE